MPSKISFFNRGIFLNNIKRFWLITFSYTLFLFLYVMSYLSSAAFQRDVYLRDGLNKLGSDIFHSADIMTLLLGFFSLIAGLAVFSYMHFQKNTAMVHSLPLRRETLFATNYLSGLFIVAFPVIFNGIVLVAGEALIGTFSNLDYAFIWIGVNLVITLLLYSFTVFAGMFTGHMAAQAIFYLIFNFLAFFLESMVQLVQSNFLFGFSSSSFSLEAWSPLYYISMLFSGFAQMQGNIGVVVGYLVAALIFLVSSFFLYRKRHMEVASDVISFPAVKPIFKYSVAFCSSALLGSILVSILNIRENVIGYIVTYLFGGLIGYFSAEMLLRKTFRVFKAYKGFLVFALILVLLLCSVSFDFFGYENRIPQDNEVEVMYMTPYPDDLSRLALRPEDYQPQKHRYWFNSPDLINDTPQKLTEEHIKELRSMAGIIDKREGITKARQIHAYIVEHKDLFKKTYYSRAFIPGGSMDGKNYNLSFAYRLKNGNILERQYNLLVPKELPEFEQLLREYMALPTIREKYEPMLSRTAADFRSIYVASMDGKNGSLRISDVEGFLKVYKQDILAQDPLLSLYQNNEDRLYGLELSLDMYETQSFFNRGQVVSIPLFLSYENTVNFLLKNDLITQDQIKLSPEIHSKY